MFVSKLKKATRGSRVPALPGDPSHGALSSRRRRQGPRLEPESEQTFVITPATVAGARAPTPLRVTCTAVMRIMRAYRVVATAVPPQT